MVTVTAADRQFLKRFIWDPCSVTHFSNEFLANLSMFMASLGLTRVALNRFLVFLDSYLDSCLVIQQSPVVALRLSPSCVLF
jgi:hypothetical protein